MARKTLAPGGISAAQARAMAAYRWWATPLLKAMHRSEQHVGKVPESESTRFRASQELGRLEEELKKAVGEERFEDAAHVRDRITICRARLAADRGAS